MNQPFSIYYERHEKYYDHSRNLNKAVLIQPVEHFSVYDIGSHNFYVFIFFFNLINNKICYLAVMATCLMEIFDI
ncbi:hypothetical protein BKM01_08880 [Methanohalophilus portucalensis]|uniref:Uncharacterized protein n=2 Tax=Methanohalophilus portucalensis TaxID=39664 RepID=A0A1X7MW15_9EURY|nr:hypothetical protein BKM01_08880 [Methanohalophilus portucalensis]SMH28588.1 hypothetical protein SAMN06264941_0061 [Methanohalophilus portucalensis FDF-1]